MLALGFLSTHFAKGQDHQLMINSTWTPSTTNFLQSYPFPATTATPTQHIVGNGYDAIATRGIFYGGNLGVSQDISNYGNTGGKWSFIGAWDKYTIPSGYFPPYTISPGINYLVNYHRWGDYSAHFGLRASTTIAELSQVGEGETYTPGAGLRDAVITWAYEVGQVSNRLIFQSIVGVHPPAGGGGFSQTANEWATILSNGNIGSGTSNPTAQFQIKPLNTTLSIPLMQITDASNTPKFIFTKGTYRLGLGVSAPTEALDVFGNIYVAGKFGINKALTTGGPNFHMDGKAFIDGCTLEIKGPLTGTTFPLSVLNNAGVSFFTVSDVGNVNVGIGNLSLINGNVNVDNGNISVTNGDLFLPAITGSGTFPRILAINSIGQVVSGPAPTANTLWEVGTNNFGGGSTYSFGTTSTDDVEFKAGDTLAFKIHGINSSLLGYTEFNKPVSIGITPSSDWGLSLKSLGTGSSQGAMSCLNSSGNAVFEVQNSGVYLPSLKPTTGTLVLSLDNTGKIVTSGTFTNDWNIAGNIFSGSGASYKFGSTSTADDKIEFFAGGKKVFDIWKDATNSQVKEGSTNFCRNVSIQGGSTATGYPDGNGGLSASSTTLPNENDPKFSLTIRSAINYTGNGSGGTLAYPNYNDKGILMCRDGERNSVMSVGAHEIDFFSDFSSGTVSAKTTRFVSYDYGDDFYLMQSNRVANNTLIVFGQTDIRGKTVVRQSILPVRPTAGTPPPINLGHDTARFNDIYGNNLFTTNFTSTNFFSNNIRGDTLSINKIVALNLSGAGTSDIGSLGFEFGRIYSRQIYGRDIIQGNQFKPRIPATAGTGSSIGNSTERFNEIWGEYIHADTLLPMNSGVSTIGSSSNFFQEIWTWKGDISGSDIRFKENINPLKYGLKTILSLKPYTYNFKSSNKGLHHGFIAQDLQKIFSNSIVAGEETDSSYLGVRYGEFVPILTLAIQQQQAIIDSLRHKLDLVFASNKIIHDSKITAQKEVLNQLPLLFQNHPNPFNGFTYIDYFLPDNIIDAFLRVIDNNGKLLKAFPINKTGFGQVELDCYSLASGTYYYSLLVNAKIIDTKSMIIAITD